MTPRAKLALGGVVVVGTLAALFATSKTAKADTLPVTPPNTPRQEPWPSDGMPWMMYSTTTLSAQRRYNRLAGLANSAAIETIEFQGEGAGQYPFIDEDGVLGPESCDALGINMPRLDPSWSPPIACQGRI